MSKLTPIEFQSLELLFQMTGGYVLNFTNAIFKDFFNQTLILILNQISMEKIYQRANALKTSAN